MTKHHQLSLVLGAEESEFYECRGVFAASYLHHQWRSSADFADERETLLAYEQLKQIWQQHAAALGKRPEAFTRTHLLEPMLSAMHWRYIPEASLPNALQTRKRPDYCLYAKEDEFNCAAAGGDVELYRLAGTVLEAKKFGHPLDRVSHKETPNWFPSRQIEDYLQHARDAQGHRFFNWAILTNGSEWRLYSERAAPGAYFVFYLMRNGLLCSAEDFRLFYSLFRAEVFARDAEGHCLLDAIHKQALRAQAELEFHLRKRVFGVLEDLGSALLHFPENRLEEKDFPAVYENALILLYRLLFILYAESRGLLPVKERGAGANRLYLNDFSLARLTDDLRDKTKFNSAGGTNLYDHLLRLCHLINGSRERQNRECGVTRYNGGLFNPDLHPLLETWRIDDKALGDVLRQLIFAQPPARASQRQLQLSTDETIDYSTLEVRQLGDIYEGLLGAHFVRVGDRLELRDENGENHRHGIFYTPDWVVKYLVRETLAPQLAGIENAEDVQRALAAKSEEKRRDNSFAHGVLRLSIVDPAMGSGHFLVRADEALADHILRHPTTRIMTRAVVSSGPGKIGREEIIAQGLVPISPGISQEQAEIAYWRRRVVEACIYGVDINPMAVELAKLSLWLTCIATDEPLNFLDHHLRCGNALLSVTPAELRRPPVLNDADDKSAFELGQQLQVVLSGVISETLRIETIPSTEMEVVKEKEQRWQAAQKRLQPFLDLAHLWLAAQNGAPVDSLHYLTLAKLLVTADAMPADELREAKRFLKSIGSTLAAKAADLKAFHWQLEFPDVFFDEQGQLLPPPRCGFDAILGNPPYISTHTSSAEKWRNALEHRAGYLEDLYVHFSDFGFRLLHDGGGFGFIVSDTFFTLASKLRMRELLQYHHLRRLGQCDPFDATVDAAIFVAQKRGENAPPSEALLFIQARPLRRKDGTRTEPEEALPFLPAPTEIQWQTSTEVAGVTVRHATFRELRIHEAPLALFTSAHKRVFFEPRPQALALYSRFNEPVKELVAEWWDKIEDSRAFAENLGELRKYHRTLKPGDVTLVGLIAEGGQGMRTANNARFLAYLEGTPQAEDLRQQNAGLTARWLADARIAPRFRQFLEDAGGNPAHPNADRAAWEAAVHRLREQFKPEELGFGRMSLFRIAPRALVATGADFQFVWQQRKAELLARWQRRRELVEFWGGEFKGSGTRFDPSPFRAAETISDVDFCSLCQALQRWVKGENTRRKGQTKILADVLGLRSSEDYDEPTDAPRIAVIYNGLSGHGQFLPFRKGDPEGSRWVDNEPLFVEWTSQAVAWLSTSPMARWQGHTFFLTAGVTWTAVANHVALKSRYQEPCIFDADSMRLTPVAGTISAESFLALMNSDVFSFFKMRFVQHTQKWEIGNLRQIPLVIPTKAQGARLGELARLAMACKRAEFARTMPAAEVVARTRELGRTLREEAPTYLQPSAQELLLETTGDCLAVIERAVNWEAEQLYGVPGLGPFDEF